MSFEQIRVFMGLDVSGFTKGLEKVRAQLSGAQGGLSKLGLGGIGGLSKGGMFLAASAAVAALAKGLMAAGERAQQLRDMANETGLALDSGTKNVAAFGDRLTSVANTTKKAWAWYTDLFEKGLQAFGAGKARNTSAGQVAAQSAGVASTSRDRAVQDARIAAAEAVLLADEKIAAKEKEISVLNQRQIEDKKKIEEIDKSTDAGAALANKLQADVNARNLAIIGKQGQLDAEKLARSREIAASEDALWQTEKQRFEINASHGQKMAALELQAQKIEQLKSRYAGDTVKQNELQNQANQVRNEILQKEKDFKLEIMALDQEAATQAVSVMLNNDLRMVQLLKEQADQHRQVASVMNDEVEKKKMLADAQGKENQALQIYRAMRERVLSNEAAMLGLRREFTHLGDSVLGTELSRAAILRQQAEDAVKMARLEQDKETRAQKLLAAQGLMNQAIAAELKTRTSINGLSDIADPKNKSERGRLARRAQGYLDKAKEQEAKGNFQEADKLRRLGQAEEEKILGKDRSRLAKGINPKDAAAGKEANQIFSEMKKELQEINKTLSNITAK